METTTCFQCGNDSLREAAIEMTGERNGQSFRVLTDGYRCDVCGFKTIDNDQSEDFTRKVSDAYRSVNGLLTSMEIKERRTAMGMTQQQFASYLGVGVASIRRWELGQIQDRAMDNLIRVMTDVAAALSNVQSICVHTAEPSAVFCANHINMLQGELVYLAERCEQSKPWDMKMVDFDFKAFAIHDEEDSVAA